MLTEKVDSGLFIFIDILMDVLYELICSQRFLKSRQKEFVGMYNKALLMSKEGDKLDTFVSQLSRDIAACKLEEFRCTNYSILIMINTLQSADKHKEKFTERLNQLYDAAEADGRVLDIATIQSEIRSFWRTIQRRVTSNVLPPVTRTVRAGYGDVQTAFQSPPQTDLHQRKEIGRHHHPPRKVVVEHLPLLVHTEPCLHRGRRFDRWERGLLFR